jgi:polysaccharide biosynthesis protein PslF
MRVGYLSTYPPRECGIANFTKDLIDATVELDRLTPYVVALNERNAIYDYDRCVKFTIDRDDAEDYRKAARYVNDSGVRLMVIQHEFGIFGGDYGEYLRLFLENLHVPVITTLHTVQPNFPEKALKMLDYLVEKSAKTVVIARPAIKILRNQGIRCNNCVVIPHGCPNIEQTDSEHIKDSLGLKDHLVASTIGLINSGKGIEYAIQAIPRIIKKEPKMIYLIIGETHPEVRKNEGEKYRNELMKLVNELGIGKHVRFTNRFLTRHELIKYLQATDIYLTPYISPNQISSGALTYALGAGKAVVSTPYFHAQDALANERGVLCEFKDPSSIADGIEKLLDFDYRRRIERNAYRYSRRFLWKNVAREYIGLIRKVTKKQGDDKVEKTSR